MNASMLKNNSHRIFAFIVLTLASLMSLQYAFSQSGCNLPIPSLYEVGYPDLTQGNLSWNYTFNGSNNYEGGCDASINYMRKKLFLKVDLGDDYEYGKYEWSVDFDLNIKIIGGGNTGVRLERNMSFSLHQDQPEQLGVIELFSNNQLANMLLFQGSDRIDFVVTNLVASEAVQNKLRMSVYHELEEKIEVNDVIVTLNAPQANANGQVVNNPVPFQWSPSCNCTPNYEFQLLRLFNNDTENEDEAQSIRARVDWNKALTIDAQSSDPALILSIVEGTGYYIWRVRPIGSAHSYGSGNALNWGNWSDQAIWEAIANSGSQEIIIPNLAWTQNKAYIFFYQQFDEDKNWIYSRTFSEADRWEEGKAKVSEQMTYANGLLQTKQHQTHLFSQGNVLANQTLLDFSGRPALTTLYAPLNRNHLGFESNFMKAESESYSSKHFDADPLLENFGINYNNPDAVTSGKLHDYYSNVNPDKSIPSAEGYPFSRSLFYGDGMSRPKEGSGVGKALRIQSGTSASHTTRVYYSGVSDTELIRVFGDEAPRASSVLKKITYDPNQTVTVVYQDKQGQTLATCLSANDNSAHHDPLPSRSSFAVVDTISGYWSCGTGCLITQNTFFLAQETNVEVHYELSPQTVEELCTNSCTTCDYNYRITIKRLDDPYDVEFPKLIHSELLPPELCENTTDINWTESVNLSPGLYLIEKVIEVNNIDPETQEASSETAPYGTTYLESQLGELEDNLINNITSDALWQTINSYLENGQTEALYAYLEANYNLAPDAESFTFTAGCCEFTIPVFHCEDCPFDGQDFEAYYQQVYSEGDLMDDLQTQELEFLPGYQEGEFNQLIQNMLSDPLLETPYDPQVLCGCWVSVVQAWEASSTTDINLDDEFDLELPPIEIPGLLDQFMQCAGRKLRDISNTAWTTNFEELGYLSHAYACFEYISGQNPLCEEAFCDEIASFPGLQCNGSNIDWENSTLSQEAWLQFYHCSQSATLNSDAGQIAEEMVQEMETACDQGCEDRYTSYVNALIDLYQNDLNYSIESDCDGTNNCVTFADIYCQADKLVELCKLQCTPLSPIMDGNDIVGYGTSEEILAYQQAMYYTFEISLGAQNGRCPRGFPLSTAVLGSSAISGTDFAELVVNYLNAELGAFINNTVDGAPFNWVDVLNTFQEGLGDHCLSEGIDEVTVPAVEGSYFELRRCELHFVTPNTIQTKKRLVSAICKDICGTLSDCGNICMRWVEPQIQEADHTFELISCQEQTATYSSYLIQEQLQNCVQDSLTAYELSYLRECIHPDSIRDLLSISYELGYYHYTLYYYDRAGNLIQTVPPEGVAENNSYTRQTHPAHEMRTQYQYNSLGQLIWQHTPDGGNTQFWYDYLGQLRFSQNAQQKLDGTCAYTKFDHLGRVIEIGKMPFPSTNTLEEMADTPTYPNGNNLSERIYTVYTTPYPNSLINDNNQRFLQNRVSYSYTDEQVATIYSYDPHGNVDWMIQDIMPELTMNDISKRQFVMEYDYDLISNKVVEMRYMPGRADQFFHRYNYNEDNSITEVHTSQDGFLWDRDAHYEYYTYGPLKRTLIGEDQIQGIDYVYTLQGWLKSINHPLLANNIGDSGGDGYSNSNVPLDVFASGLSYFKNDFVKSGSLFQDQGIFYAYGLTPERNLYNGNISLWVSNTRLNSVNQSFKYPKLTARQFRYDELNRITNSDFKYRRLFSWANTDEYDSNYQYDANGNLLRLNRNGYKLSGQVKMDKLSYTYNSMNTGPENNRLERVVDGAFPFGSGSPYEGDLEFRRAYTYDAIGNIIKDDPSDNDEQNLNMTWNLLGKVQNVTKTNGSTDATEMTVNYRYDAAGNRIMKKVTADGSSNYTWYVRDASGNILSIYSLNEYTNNLWQTVQEEVPLYGSQRLGTIYQQNKAFGKNMSGQDAVFPAPEGNVFSRLVGDKAYELHDHLGNVRMTVSDIKLSSINSNHVPRNFKAEILSGAEYYPFGSLMVGREFSAERNRFGFQGQETDHEERGLGNDVHFTFREYDSRVGRFGAVDPLEVSFPWNSPYAFSENRVIDGTELEGLEVNLMNVDVKRENYRRPVYYRNQPILTKTESDEIGYNKYFSQLMQFLFNAEEITWRDNGIALHLQDGGGNHSNVKGKPNADIKSIDADILALAIKKSGSGRGLYSLKNLSAYSRNGYVNDNKLKGAIQGRSKSDLMKKILNEINKYQSENSNLDQTYIISIESILVQNRDQQQSDTYYKAIESDGSVTYKRDFSMYGVKQFTKESNQTEFDEALKTYNDGAENYIYTKEEFKK